MTSPDERESLLDELTRPGIDIPDGDVPLVLDRGSWLSRCVAAVRSGELSAADALASQLEDGQEAAEAFDCERFWTTDRSQADDDGKPAGGGARISAARALLGVAYAALDRADEQVWLSRAMAHWRQANVLMPEATASHGFAQLLLPTVQGSLADPTRRVHSPVLFGGPAKGAAAILTVAAQPGGPPGLYPDPRSMAFLTADGEFADSLAAAWHSAPTAIRERCVTWDISDEKQPLRSLHEIWGGSLGAALAVALHDLARAARPLGAARIRRLDPRCAVTGRLGPDGRLLPVTGYRSKLDAASLGKLRVVVPADDPEAVTQADIPRRRVAYARDLKTAIRKSRRLRLLPHGIGALIVLLVLSAAVVGTAAQRARSGEQAAIAGQALQQKQTVAGQLLTEADKLSASDPELAAQVLLTGYRLSQQSQDFAWRLVSTESQILSTSLDTSKGGSVVSAAFSPNGAILAAGADNGGSGSGGVTLWDVSNPAQPRPLSEPLTASNGPGAALVAFSPKGAVLAASSGGDVTLWDVSNPARPHELAQPLTADGGPADSVAFSPNGATIAVGGSGGVTLWDVGNPARPRQLGQARTAYGGRVAFTPDGTTLAVGDDNFGGGVTLWDVSNPAQPRQLGQALTTGNGEPVVSVAISPRGATLAASSGGDVTLWDVSNPAQPRRLGQPLTAGRVVSVAFSPGGTTLAAASTEADAVNGSVMLWDVSNPAQPSQLSQALTSTRGGPVTAVAFSPEGTLAATGSGGVTLWDPPSAALPSSAAVEKRNVVSLAFSPSSAALAAADDFGDEMTLWDVSDPARPRQLGPPLTADGAEVKAVAFSPDGATLAVAAWDLRGGVVTLWDVHNLAKPRKLSQPLTASNELDPPSLAFSPHGAILAISGDDGVTLWDVGDPARPLQLGPPLTSSNGAAVTSVAFSPNGAVLAARADDKVTLWDVSNPAQPHQLSQPLVNEGLVTSIAFSPNGKTLAVAAYNLDGGGVTLWDVSTPARPRKLSQLDETLIGTTADRAVSVAFSPNDATLALAGAADDGVTLWDVSDPAQPSQLSETLNINGGTVASLAFSPNGAALAVGADGTKIWDLNTGDAISRICDLIGVGMTHPQWSQYIPELPYDPPCANHQ